MREVRVCITRTLARDTGRRAAPPRGRSLCLPPGADGAAQAARAPLPMQKGLPPQPTPAHTTWR
jgi:hypothetical protein